MTNRTVKFRLYTLVALTIALGISMSLLSMESLRQAERLAGEQIKESLLDGQKQRLKLATEAMALALGTTIESVENEAEKLDILRKSIFEFRYEEDASGYFFIYDGTVNLAHPPKPSLHGTDLGDVKDPNGVYFIRELDAAAKRGGGFVEYVFDKPNKGKQPKIAYAALIEGTDYFIGTGIYIDNLEELQELGVSEIQEGLATIKRVVLSVAFLLVIAIGVFSELINRSISIPLKKAIASLSLGSAEIGQGIAQVSESNQTLAEGASEQAASLEESAASITEINDQVGRNEAIARKTRESAIETSKAARDGVEAVTLLKNGVGSVNDSAKEMENAMSDIKQASDAVSKIIKTIDEIAFQTNILALNAAVEAARAGEAGAGFAVVADEVRSLAGRAAAAAKETTKLIEDSVESSDRGVRVNEQVGQHLQEVYDRAEAVESGLLEITNSVEEVTGAMEDITSSVREQHAGIGQIDAAINQINDITQTSAAQSQESASAAQEIHAQSIALHEVVGVLSSMVDAHRSRQLELPQKPLSTPRLSC